MPDIKDIPHRHVKKEWVYSAGGRQLAGLIGNALAPISRHVKLKHKPRNCQTSDELVELARSVFRLPSEIKTLSEALNAVLAIKATHKHELSTKKHRKSVQKAKKHGNLQDFYDSWEWKRLRYDFIKGKNRICQCCKASAKDGIKIVVDHIKPIRHHWRLRLDPSNLQLLCDDCNKGKGSRDETNWCA